MEDSALDTLEGMAAEMDVHTVEDEDAISVEEGMDHMVVTEDTEAVAMVVAAMVVVAMEAVAVDQTTVTLPIRDKIASRIIVKLCSDQKCTEAQFVTDKSTTLILAPLSRRSAFLQSRPSSARTMPVVRVTTVKTSIGYA